jgi:predicted ATPase
MSLTIHIKNFRAVKDTQLEVKSGVNVLIGPNGSGKTSLFLALKFLRDVLLHGVGLAVAKGGGPKRTFRRHATRMSFAVEHTLETKRIFRRRKVPFKFIWEIDIAERGHEKISTIIRERFAIDAVNGEQATNVLEAEIRSSNKGSTHSLRIAPPAEIGKDLVSFVHDATENKEPAIALLKVRINEIFKQAKKEKDNDKSVFSHLARFDAEMSAILYSFLNLNEYNIQPDTARESTDQLPVVEMLPNGKQLSEVIHALENRNFFKLNPTYPYGSYFGAALFGPYVFEQDYYSSLYSGRVRKDLKNALTNINNELATAVKPIQKVTARIDPTNGKRFVVFKAGDEIFYPEEVSDGTIKWLCILVSIYVPFSQLYLLEEPENFLHPWMQHKLIELMRRQAIRSGTTFVLTTHSTAILNSAKPDEVIIVKATANGTTASSIPQIETIRTALEEKEFGLGDLWVSGRVGAVPGDHE